MGKIFLLVLLGVVVLWMWRKLQAPKRDLPAAAIERPAEAMVSCAHCGVNQPRGECVESKGRLYCSDAHRLLAEQRKEEG